MVNRHFNDIDKDDFDCIYKTCQTTSGVLHTSSWSPHLKKDKACLEGVQRKETKIVTDLNSSYKTLSTLTTV